jgi:hypothetical protein
MIIKLEKTNPSTLYIDHFFSLIPRIEKGILFWFSHVRKEISNNKVSLHEDYSKCGSCVVMSGYQKKSPKDISFIQKNQFLFLNKYLLTVKI